MGNSIGDVDVWFNGGLSQPTGLNAHKGAVFFFERSIILVPTELDELTGTCAQYNGISWAGKERTSCCVSQIPESQICKTGDQYAPCTLRVPTEIDECQYVGWRCDEYKGFYDRNRWAPFNWSDRKTKDTCLYGDLQKRNPTAVGEYINREKRPKDINGNYLVFTTKDIKYCKDVDCKQTC